MINVGTIASFIKMTGVIQFQECCSVFTAFMKYKFNNGLSTGQLCTERVIQSVYIQPKPSLNCENKTNKFI